MNYLRRTTSFVCTECNQTFHGWFRTSRKRCDACNKAVQTAKAAEHYRRTRNEPIPRPALVSCGVCTTLFAPYSSRHKYCSGLCAQTAMGVRYELSKLSGQRDHALKRYSYSPRGVERRDRYRYSETYYRNLKRRSRIMRRQTAEVAELQASLRRQFAYILNGRERSAA